MSKIRFFGLGKSRLLVGAPLRILLLLESKPSTDEVLESEIEANPFLITLDSIADHPRSQPPIQAKLHHRESVQADSGIVVDVFGAEIDTCLFVPGAYEVTLRHKNMAVAMDEFLWIIDSIKYDQLLKEEVEPLRFDTQNLLHIDDGPDYPQPSLALVLNEILAEKLEGLIRVENRFTSPPTIEIMYRGGVSEYPVHADPLIYMASVLAVQCRDIALFGVKNVGFACQIYKDNCKVSCFAKLNEGLSTLMESTYKSPTTSELLILGRVLQESFKASDPVATVQISGNSVALSLATGATESVPVGMG